MKLLSKSYSSIFRLGLFFALPFFIGTMLFLLANKAKALCSDAGCQLIADTHQCVPVGTPSPPCYYDAGSNTYLLFVRDAQMGDCTQTDGSPGWWFWRAQWTGTCGTCCGGSGGYVVFNGIVLASDTGGDTWTTTCPSPPCPVPHPSPPCTGRTAPNLYLDCRDNTSCSHPTWSCFNPGGYFGGFGRAGGFIGVDLLGIPAPYNSCDWWVVWEQRVGRPETGERGEGCTAWFNPGTFDREKSVRFRMKTVCPCGRCFTICSCASVAVNSPDKEFARKTGEKAFISLVDSRKSIYTLSPERLTASFSFSLGKIFQSFFTFINNLLNKKIITNLRIWRD